MAMAQLALGMVETRGLTAAIEKTWRTRSYTRNPKTTQRR